MYGGRISLSVAFISVCLAAAIGMLFGIVSGYIGGVVDSVFQRTVDAAIAFPALLLLLIITQALGPSYRTIVFALMLAVIPGRHARRSRARCSPRRTTSTSRRRARAARGRRASCFVHILPNVVALGIIVMTTLLGGIILAESALVLPRARHPERDHRGGGT